jgi:hypothetical protein
MERVCKRRRRLLGRKVDAERNARPAGRMFEFHRVDAMTLKPSFQLGTRDVEVGSDVADFDDVKHPTSPRSFRCEFSLRNREAL